MSIDIPSMSYDECLAAMSLKKLQQPNLDHITKEVLEERTNMINEFSSLLKLVIEENQDKKIKSEELYNLWTFFCIGVYTNSLHKLNEDNMELNVKDFTRLGPVMTRKILYDRCYKLITENEHFQVYNGSPTDWYNNVKRNYDSVYNFLRVQDKDSSIPVFESICNVLSDPDCDPVLQR